MNDRLFEELLWRSEKLGCYGEVLDEVIRMKSADPAKDLADIAQEVLITLFGEDELFNK